MRVLHVINSLEVGGAEVLLCDLVACLRERGIKVSVALLTRSDTRLERAVQEVPDCEVYGASRRVRSPAQIPWLAKLLRRFDVVHSHLFPTQYWVAAAAALGRSSAKLVTTEHNPDNNRRGKYVWQWPDRWMYTQYDSIVCNSRATADALEAWIPATRQRTTVIPNGIAFQRFAGAPKEDHSSRDYRLAIFVARLDPQKDHMTLLRALLHVPQLHLQLVGDGRLRGQLQNFVEASGLRDRVEFLGWRDDVPRLLRNADFYVHSTHSDGFGIAVVEAMAAGLPVIASDVPGLSWVVGDSGILCKPGDETELARQMSRLAADPQLRGALSAKGRKRAREFDIKAVADAHIELYESIVSCRRAMSSVATA